MRPPARWAPTSCRCGGCGSRDGRDAGSHPERYARLYITLDIDGSCPSIAPGTGTLSPGGFLYYEVLKLLQGAARAHAVGIDLVEVAPDYDLTGSTAILDAQVLLNLLGFIFHARAGA